MTGDESLIADAARRVLERADLALAREQAAAGGLPEALWGQVVEVGLPWLLVPESAGGFGASLASAAQVAGLVGRYAAPIPLVETMLANTLRAACGWDVDTAPASLAFERLSRRCADPAGAIRRVVEVPWSPPVAPLLLREDGTVACPAPDGAPPQCRASLAREPAALWPLDAWSCQPPALKTAASGDMPWLARCALLHAAQITGAMQQAFELARGHAAERQQFGKPLAGFQAIQHQLAAMAAQVAACQAAVAAAAQGPIDRDDGLWLAAAAKACASAAAAQVAAGAHQIHGAMGFAEETGLHVFTTRMLAWRDAYGSEGWWHAWIGRAAVRAGAAGAWAMIGRESQVADT